jgi:hypothetical protein
MSSEFLLPPPLTSRPARGARARSLAFRTLAIIAATATFFASLAEIMQLFDGQGAPLGPPTVIVPPPVVLLTETDPTQEPDHASSPPARISGSWHLHTVVAQSTYRPFDGMRSVYRLNLIEARDGAVIGSGELWSENEIEVSGLNHLLMELGGHFDGRTLRLNFTILGRERKSTGALVFDQYDPDNGLWRGTFDSTIAASSGPAELRAR